jgi:hypothetical protein
MDTIKFPIHSLMKEPAGCNTHDRFSSHIYTRKIPKGITLIDFDSHKKLIEIEFSDGSRSWVNISVFFGKLIGESKNLLITYPDNVREGEGMSIVAIDMIKIKRTNYWKLIFERDLPF